VPEGNCVWVEGPYRGSTNDLTIFRKHLKGMIPAGKLVIADKGYKSKEEMMISINNELDDPDVKEFKSRVRSKHETFNRRIKIFKAVHDVFQHNVLKHQPVFESCAVITQYNLENGEPLFTL
jgi:hypothetical protein